MQIVVKIYGRLRELLKKPELSIKIDHEDKTVRSLIYALINEFGERLNRELVDPKTGGLSPAYLMYVNGRNISTQYGLDTQLNEKDVISILTPVGGG